MLLPKSNRLLNGHSSHVLAGEVARLSGVIGAGTPLASQAAAAESAARDAIALERL